MSTEDLDPDHWDDDTYIGYLKTREILKEILASKALNALEERPYCVKLHILERSLGIYEARYLLAARQPI